MDITELQLHSELQEYTPSLNMLHVGMGVDIGAENCKVHHVKWISPEIWSHSQYGAYLDMV